MAADGIGLLDRARDRARARRRRLDGRHDRPDDGRRGIPDRVLSLASIMSNTGPLLEGHARPAHLPDLPAPAGARPRGARSSRRCRSFRLIGSPGFPFDEDEMREAGRAELRARLQPGGQRRASSPRSSPPATAPRELRGITAPTVVIHGTTRPDGPAVRRPRDRRGDPGRAAREIDGHGPRPAARRLGPDRRRHRGQRAARGRVGPARRRRVACRRVTTITRAGRRGDGPRSRRSGCELHHHHQAVGGERARPVRRRRTSWRARRALYARGSSPRAASRCSPSATAS